MRETESPQRSNVIDLGSPTAPDLVVDAVRRARRRFFLARAARALARDVAAALAVILLVCLADVLFSPDWSGAEIVAATAAAVFVLSRGRSLLLAIPSWMEAAAEIDRRAFLKQRTVTAAGVVLRGRSGRAGRRSSRGAIASACEDLVVADCARYLSSLRLADLFPVRLPRKAALLVPLAAAPFAVIAFAPRADLLGLETSRRREDSAREEVARAIGELDRELDEIVAAVPEDRRARLAGTVAEMRRAAAAEREPAGEPGSVERSGAESARERGLVEIARREEILRGAMESSSAETAPAASRGAIDAGRYALAPDLARAARSDDPAGMARALDEIADRRLETESRGQAAEALAESRGRLAEEIARLSSELGDKTALSRPLAAAAQELSRLAAAGDGRAEEERRGAARAESAALRRAARELSELAGRRSDAQALSAMDEALGEARARIARAGRPGGDPREGRCSVCRRPIAPLDPRTKRPPSGCCSGSGACSGERSGSGAPAQPAGAPSSGAGARPPGEAPQGAESQGAESQGAESPEAAGPPGSGTKAGGGGQAAGARPMGGDREVGFRREALGAGEIHAGGDSAGSSTAAGRGRTVDARVPRSGALRAAVQLEAEALAREPLPVERRREVERYHRLLIERSDAKP